MKEKQQKKTFHLFDWIERVKR